LKVAARSTQAEVCSPLGRQQKRGPSFGRKAGAQAAQ
jgi:hypothetical protein